MKKLIWLGLLLWARIVCAQVAQSIPGTIATTGGTLVVANVGAFTTATFDEIPNGTPSVVSVTIQGCMQGTTLTQNCDTASDTNTGTSATIRNVSFTKIYDYFLITATFSGGTNPSMTFFSRPGWGTASSSASSVSVTSPVDGSGYVEVNCKTGCPGGNANGQATMANSGPVVIASNQSAVANNITQVAGSTLSKTNPVQIQTSDGTNQITAAISAYGTAPTGTEVEGVNAFVTNLISGNITQFGGVNVSTGTGASGTGIPRVTISNDSSLAANQSVNVNQFGGTSATAKAASTQSVAGDTSLVMQINPNQPALTTPWVDNITQFGGTNVSTGTGAGGTGIPRVTVSNDSQIKVWDGSNQATIKAAATNAAPSTDTSLVVQILAQGLSPCSGFFGGNVFTTVSGTTSGTSATQIVALSASKKIWVCSTLFTSTSGTTPTISLVYGTGSNCATGQTVLMPAMALGATAGTPINIVGTFVTASANELCYLQTGTTPVASYSITYAQL